MWIAEERIVREQIAGAVERHSRRPATLRAGAPAPRLSPAEPSPPLEGAMIWGVGRWGRTRWGPERFRAAGKWLSGRWGEGRWLYFWWGREKVAVR